MKVNDLYISEYVILISITAFGDSAIPKVSVPFLPAGKMPPLSPKDSLQFAMNRDITDISISPEKLPSRAVSPTRGHSSTDSLSQKTATDIRVSSTMKADGQYRLSGIVWNHSLVAMLPSWTKTASGVTFSPTVVSPSLANGLKQNLLGEVLHVSPISKAALT